MRFITLSILLIIWSCKPQYDDLLSSELVDQTYVPVRVQTIEQSVGSIPVYALGRVASQRETKLSFKIGGYIASLDVDEGRAVRKGQKLGALRSQEIDAQVVKATRGLDKARRDLDRIKAMYADSIATLEQVQNLETAVDVAEADLRIASFNQANATIISPTKGKVIARLAEPYELVSPGQPILVIASSGSEDYIVKAHVSDKDISRIRVGAMADMSLDAIPDRTLVGAVVEVSERADPMTGTFEVELSLKGITQGELRTGMITRVKIYPSEEEKYIRIPMISISEGSDDKALVFVPDAQRLKAHAKTVKVVHISDNYAWIDVDDLGATEIITDGSAYLEDGVDIKIINR